MPAKEYGCSYCKVIFTKDEPQGSEDKAEMKCPYCRTSHVQKLDTPSDKFRFIHSLASGYG